MNKVCKGRRSYSRLLSPFHLQLPLYFPELSPGTQTPLSTSASSTSSSRGIRPEDMFASEACIGATAQSQGLWEVLSHTLSYLTQLYGEIQNNNNPSSSCLTSLGALALGHDTKTPGGGGPHTHCRHPPPLGNWNYPSEVNSFTDCKSSIDRKAKYAWSFTLKY